MATTTSKDSNTDVNLSQKLSLRQRLFSSASRKTAGAPQTPSKLPKQSQSQPTDSVPPAAAASNHQGEPSVATSKGTLTAGQQPQHPDTEPAGTPTTNPLAVAEDPPEDMLIRTKHDNSDREPGSGNTTLTSKDRRVPFYRRKTGNKSSASNAPLTSTSDPALSKAVMGTSASSRTSSSTRSKPSFLSRVVQKVVPCVSPDPDLIATPINERATSPIPDSRRMSTNKDPSTTGTIEMQQVDQEAVSSPPTPGAVVAEKPAGRSASPAAVSPQPQSASPSEPTPAPIDLESLPLAITPTSAKDSQPPSPTDSEIIIPPPLNTHLLPEEETDGVTSGAVQPPGSTGHSTPGEAPHKHLHGHESSGDESDGTTYSDEDDDRHMRDEHDEEEWLIKNGGSGIPIGPDGLPKPLLPPILPEHAGRKCLVLDLDETLVHSSFKAVQQADFIVPVEIEYHWHHFHVLKRPGVDNFLQKMGEIYEIVVFTASLSKYADPVLDKLDIHNVVAHRLFRESCFSHKGNYVKDLSQLGRPIADTIILDNSPASYIFHPNNAVPVSSWFNDPHDAELTDLIPFLADLTPVPDVRSILDGAR